MPPRGAITGSDISSNARILGTQIADGTITTRNLSPLTVLGTQIVNQTITYNNIAPSTIQGSNIDASTITATNISARTITGDLIDFNTVNADNISTLNMVGKTAVFDTGTIGGWTMGATELQGPVGAVIRAGQTDFNVGTGFWLGNTTGTPKFSIGTAAGNGMSWDGTNLRVTGNFTPTSVFNTYTYTVANLPVPPTTIGFSPPSANE